MQVDQSVENAHCLSPGATPPAAATSPDACLCEADWGMNDTRCPCHTRHPADARPHDTCNGEKRASSPTRMTTPPRQHFIHHNRRLLFNCKTQRVQSTVCKVCCNLLLHLCAIVAACFVKDLAGSSDLGFRTLCQVTRADVIETRSTKHEARDIQRTFYLCQHGSHFDCIVDWLASVKDTDECPCPCCRQQFISMKM